MVLAAVLRAGPTLSKARKAKQASVALFALSSLSRVPPTSNHAGTSQACVHDLTLYIMRPLQFFGRIQAWVGGFSNLMDELRNFMAGRQAPFRLKGLRAIFVTQEDELDEEDKVCDGGIRACFCFGIP